MSTTRLYLLRHGDAGDKRTWKGNDKDRPLSSMGIEQTKATARYLASASIRPSRILSSPYARALQTAEIVAELLGTGAPTVIEDRLAPGFGIDGLCGILGDNDVDRLLLVGHDPSFSNVIGKVIGGGSILLKKGGFVRLDLSELSPPRGRLVWLTTPSLLG